MEGGSSAFKMYFLDNITDDNYIDTVQKELEHKFDVPKPQISKLLGIIAFSIACDDALKGIKNFITKFNKGKIPVNPEPLDQWEIEIQETTYFGSLVKPLFDISQQIKQLQIAKLENQMSVNNPSISLGMNNPNDTSIGTANSMFDMSGF